jgi:hypothetical protein
VSNAITCSSSEKSSGDSSSSSSKGYSLCCPGCCAYLLMLRMSRTPACLAAVAVPCHYQQQQLSLSRHSHT